MGKYLSIIIGAAVAIIGLWALVGWRGDFVTVLKGTLPAMLVFGGIIALIAGISELQDKLASKKNENK